METDINLHVVFVTAFIHKDGKYLLAKRSSTDKQAAGHWATPGGKVDMELGSDIVEDTLRREIREEVGLEVGSTFKYLSSEAFTRSSGHHVVKLNFIAEWESGEAVALEDQDAVQWFTREELIQLVNDNVHLEYLRKNIELLPK